MKVKKNLVYQLTYQILIIFIPLITTPYLTRVLHADGMGRYGYANTIVSYFALFCMLGLSYHGNRTIAGVRDNSEELRKEFWSMYAIQFFFSILTFIFYCVFLLFSERDYVCYVLILTLLSSMIDISWFYFGLENIKKIVFRNISVRIITMCLIFLLVKTEYDLWKYALIMSGSAFFSQVILWFGIRRYVGKPVVEKIYIQRNIKPILILFIPVIAVSVYKMMDKIMLGSLSSNAYYDVAMYEAAEKIVNIPLSFISALGVVMLPRISNLQAHDKTEDIKKYNEVSIQLAMLMGCAFGFGIPIIGNSFTILYFGAEYVGAIEVLTILSFVTIITSWQQVIRTQIITPRKMDKSFTISVLIGAVINFCINAILIPKYGASGVAFASLLTEFIVMAINTFSVRNYCNVLKMFKDGIGFVFIGLIMLVTISSIHIPTDSLFLNIITKVLLAAIVYLMCSYIYMKIFKMELQSIVKSSLRKLIKERRCNI